MQVGIIVRPNSKGQIVIPKKIREELSITQKTHLNLLVRNKGVYMYAIETVESAPSQNREVFLEFLKRNRGRWGPASKEELVQERKRRVLELQASGRRKQAW